MESEQRTRIPIVRAKDCDVSYFVGPGAGGQKKNKTASGVQIKHRESGAIGRCSESRSQLENKKSAFISLTQTGKFKVWLAAKLYEIRQGETLEQTIDALMVPENIITQIKNEEGNWKTVTELENIT